MNPIGSAPLPAPRSTLAPSPRPGERGAGSVELGKVPQESDEARLKKTAKQLEGVFVEQLYKAMRETVPQDEGAIGAGTGEDMFTGLMDQKLAAETPTQWAHGLADAAYRQLRKALPQEGAANAATAANDLARPGAPAKAAPAMKLTPSSAAMPLRPQPAISLSPVAPGDTASR